VELITAAPTPFTASGELDLDAARRVFGYATDAGASLLVAGTTGEFPSLEDDERISLFEVALEVAGPERVIVHVGAADARRATRLAAAAVARGATRLAAITPYYLPARTDEIAAYFGAIRAAAADARLYAYLFTERTGNSLAPADLGSIPGLAGVKISGSGTERLAEYVRPGFAVYSGDDGHVEQAALDGAAGSVSGVSAVLPAPFVELASLLNDGGDRTAVDARTRQAAALLGPSIGRLKYGLSVLGLAGPYGRMTVDPPGPTVRAAIEALVTP
jgi:4-hydroxy-tetrahydrodipicolinate synthase